MVEIGGIITKAIDGFIIYWLIRKSIVVNLGKI